MLSEQDFNMPTTVQLQKKKLEAKAYRLWKKASFKKWGKRCLICNMPADDLHHFIPKSSSLMLKYDVNNAIPLCRKHHDIIHFGPNKIEKDKVIDTIKKKRGKKWVQYIEKMKNVRTTKSIQWLEEQIYKLKNVK